MRVFLYLGAVLALNTPDFQESILKCIQSNPKTKEFAALLARPQFSDLAELLSGQDSSRKMTVFAPSNEAMAQFPSIGLMTSVPIKDVLRYHIMPGLVTEKMIDSLHFGSSAYSYKGRVQGLKLARTAEGKMQISSGPLPPAYVLAADLKASNGAVHVIDRLLVPPYSVEETLKMANLTNFLALAVHNDLIVSMDKTSGGTVFAPTNDAIENLMNANPDMINDDEVIYNFVRWHFAPKQVRFSSRISASSPATLETLAGRVELNKIGDNLEVNHVPIRRADLITRYGVLYVLDGTIAQPAEHSHGGMHHNIGNTREAMPISN
ncbi:hypothetical protein DSO57_1015090 [Entomophthora muscae]|uniref:Uncharacterized protein n=1 Tax=Entomophthora muscae TaxID=34485 RepID=A0ACC2T5E5_9FUNG|nr:hypothetical protein DSO57_1015090 [Entomophthora muscae]